MSETSLFKPATAAAPKLRPLSPHLQVYRLPMTAILSVLHRMSGVVLCGGLVIFAVWLAALAGGPESYSTFVMCARSLVGQIILAGISLAFFHHLCAGIRHLLWDTGLFLEKEESHKTDRVVIAAALLLTAVTWLKIYGVGL